MGKDDKASVTSLLQDMEKLKELLETYHFKDHNRIELTDLEGAVNTIKSNVGTKKKKKITFSTGNEGITFHTLANGMSPNPGILEGKLELTLVLKYEYNCEESNLKEIFNGYELDLRIVGTEKNPYGHYSKHYFEWLQDVPSPKNKTDAKYKYIHPHYHFHAGGAFLKSKASGSLVQLSSPRLPHPPMDIVLAVNFIICNFFSTQEAKFAQEMKILDDEDYQKLVSRAARRLYTPYIEEIRSDITNSEFMPLFTT